LTIGSHDGWPYLLSKLDPASGTGCPQSRRAGLPSSAAAGISSALDLINFASAKSIFTDARLSEDRPLITVDGAIWVLVLTAIAYAVAFGYQDGYLKHFGVPAPLVEVSLYSLYHSLMWVGLIAGLVFITTEFGVVRWLLQPMLKVEKFPFVPKFLLAGAILYVLVGAVLDSELAWGTASIFIVGLAISLIAPIFTDKKKRYRSYAERLAVVDTHLRAGVDMSPRFAFVIFAIMLTLIAFQVASAAGQAEARKRKEFLVADIPPPCVIVHPFGDRLICAEFADGRLTGQIHLLAKEDRDLELTLKKVGPLQSAPGDELAAGQVK
jgi:hypothetical protein